MLGSYPVLDYFAYRITLPYDANIAVLVDAAGVEANELVQGPGRRTAAGAAVRGELVGGEVDGRTGLAGPGAAVDQEGGQVPPEQAGRPGDGSPSPHAKRAPSWIGSKPMGKPITWSSVPSSILSAGAR